MRNSSSSLKMKKANSVSPSKKDMNENCEDNSSEEEQNDRLQKNMKKSIKVGNSINERFTKYVNTGQFIKDVEYNLNAE